MPAASIVKLLEFKRPAQISDEMLILADMAQKARVQVASFVAQVLLKHMPEKKAIATGDDLKRGTLDPRFSLARAGGATVRAQGLDRYAAQGVRTDGSLSARRRRQAVGAVRSPASSRRPGKQGARRSSNAKHPGKIGPGSIHEPAFDVIIRRRTGHRIKIFLDKYTPRGYSSVPGGIHGERDRRRDRQPVQAD